MPVLGLDGEKKPPTSHQDSLVVVDAGVGGGGCWRPRWKAKGTHQRVFTTRWWWWMPVLGLDGEKKPPTSPDDSLVVADAGILSGPIVIPIPYRPVVLSLPVYRRGLGWWRWSMIVGVGIGCVGRSSLNEC